MKRRILWCIVVLAAAVAGYLLWIMDWKTPGAEATEKERIATGLTVINVQAGAKVYIYPMGDFIIQAADGAAVTVMQPQKAERGKGQKVGLNEGMKAINRKENKS